MYGCRGRQYLGNLGRADISVTPAPARPQGVPPGARVGHKLLLLPLAVDSHHDVLGGDAGWRVLHGEVLGNLGRTDISVTPAPTRPQGVPPSAQVSHKSLLLLLAVDCHYDILHGEVLRNGVIQIFEERLGGVTCDPLQPPDRHSGSGNPFLEARVSLTQPLTQQEVQGAIREGVAVLAEDVIGAKQGRGKARQDGVRRQARGRGPGCSLGNAPRAEVVLDAAEDYR
eukprot:CAMPEP_0175239656 /NCGR_PEP_ID=MMETSP0093-20121207/29655_1 /TAXON_ID=311494 /ORGANISM="Alexandrium monilatum, Strain CCMP3105" /LENGTH=226 /DNA_ID=CAMNT_0016533687 /DNA_START=198 /DNA_END=874 /DNA_ORIENTATION=-